MQYSRQPVCYDGTCATTGKNVGKTVYLYADGACKGNPSVSSWGILLRCGTYEKELFGDEAETTNNRMELTVVIEGLKSLKRRCTVKICTDSQYVENGMESWIHDWKKNGWKTAAKQPVKNDDLWKELDNLARQYDVRWTWVKGHAGHPESERADVLVNQGVAQFLWPVCESKRAFCSKTASKTV